MKRPKLLLVAGLLLALVPIALMRNVWGDVRSVIPYSGDDPAQSGPFDRAQSAALFVGISKFHEDRTLTDVRYAVDDAVDLAYAFTLGCGSPLVRPARVVLALTGLPRKAESRRRLDQLKLAGATVETADQTDLQRLLRAQAALAGANGLFIVSFATHGFSRDGEHYLLSASSLFDDIETTLPAAKLFDIAGSSAARSLIFVDACRDRVHESRAIGHESKSAAPLLSAMNKVAGQVIFYAAPAGGYAYDDERRHNGVFTAAVIEGLSCRAAKKRNIVTVDTLSTYVEKNVLEWVQKNQDRTARKATQLNTEGSTRFMPLVYCDTAAPPETPAPTEAAFEGSVLNVYGQQRNPLWQQRVAGRIRISRIAELFRKRTRQTVVVSDDERGDSLISAYEQNGALLFTYPYPGRIESIAIAQRTPHYDPKIIATATSSRLAATLHVPGPVSTVFVLDPKRTGTAEAPLWHGYTSQTIDRMEITDYDRNGKRDIALSTTTGSIIHLEFEGTLIAIEPGHGEAARFSWAAAQ
jgi:hypothetical protein